jgi:hypothetical protein
MTGIPTSNSQSRPPQSNVSDVSVEGQCLSSRVNATSVRIRLSSAAIANKPWLFSIDENSFCVNPVVKFTYRPRSDHLCFYCPYLVTAPDVVLVVIVVLVVFITPALYGRLSDTHSTRYFRLQRSNRKSTHFFCSE